MNAQAAYLPKRRKRHNSQLQENIFDGLRKKTSPFRHQPRVRPLARVFNAAEFCHFLPLSVTSARTAKGGDLRCIIVMPCYTCLTHNAFILSPARAAPADRNSFPNRRMKLDFFGNAQIARRSFSHGHIECLSHEYKILQSRIALSCVGPIVLSMCVRAV